MDYEKIMEAALHNWATKLNVHSHTFIAALLKPAFKAAYEAGLKDTKKGVKTPSAAKGVRAGFLVIKKLTGQK